SIGFIFFIYLFYKKYTTDLFFEHIFLPLTGGKIYEKGYTLFSYKHIYDLFNQYHLLFPSIMIILIYSWRSFKSTAKNMLSLFMLIALVSEFIYIFFVDPKLGMPRDWDLFSLAGLPVIIYLSTILDEYYIDRLKRLIPSIVLLSLLFVLPFLMTHLQEKSAIDYNYYLVKLEDKGSLYHIIILREYYSQLHDKQKVDSLTNQIAEKFPDEMNIRKAIAEVKKGNLRKAIEIQSNITPNKFDSEYHNLNYMIYLHMNKMDSALIAIKKAVQLQPYKPSLLNNLAVTYARLGYFDSAFVPLRRAYDLHSNNFNILTGLANVHLMVGNVDSCLFYSEALTHTDTGRAEGYYLLTKINAQRKKYEDAEKYFSEFKKINLNDPAFLRRTSELLELLKRNK
ncbi:MAG: hypothetical protein ABIJ45_07585, partial [Candidatus Zixiibacteriota bacterium]